MSNTFEKKKGVGYLAVNDEMTIYTAAAQKSELLGYLSDVNELELNLAGVTEIDSAGLQILMAMKNTAQSLGREIRFTQHSKAVIEVLELLKLSTRFADPIFIPSEWQAS